MLRIANTAETVVVGLSLRLNASESNKKCGAYSRVRLFKGSAYSSNYGIVALYYVFTII